VALIWNERLTASTLFLRGYEQLLLHFATDYEQVNHTQIDELVLNEFFAPHAFLERTFSNRQRFDYDGLEGRLLSSSYTPTPEHPRYTPMLSALRELFATHQQDGEISFDYETKVYWSALA